MGERIGRRRSAAAGAILASVLLTSGACGDRSRPQIDGSSDGVVLPDAGGGAPGAPPAGRSGPRTPRREPLAPAPAQGAQPAPTTSGTAARTPFHDEALGSPGSYARVLLQPAPVTDIVLEVLSQPGAAPAANTLSHAASAVGDAAGKRVRIQQTTLPDSGSSYSAGQLRALADEYGQARDGDATAVVRLVFVGGTYQSDSSVLGITVRGDVLAVFRASLRRASSPLVSQSTLEDAVTMHEMGHVLGLVDLARDTGRADPKHPGHSQNPHSVMYWAVESDLVGQVLDGPPPTEFDAQDRADLAALRDGA